MTCLLYTSRKERLEAKSNNLMVVYKQDPYVHVRHSQSFRGWQSRRHHFVSRLDIGQSADYTIAWQR